MSTLAQMLAKKKALAQTLSVGEAHAEGGPSTPAPVSIESNSPQASSPSADSTQESPTVTEVKASELSTIPAQATPLAKRLLTTPKPQVKTPNVMDSVAVAKVIKPELTVEALANSDGILDDPHAGERFKMTLDLFDAKLQEIGGNLDQFNIDTCRSMVSRIMIDLKEHPDYDGLYLGDRDVHNIMSFMYRVRDMAIESNVKKVVKAEKTVKKKSLAVNFGAALDNLSIGDLSL